MSEFTETQFKYYLHKGV